jgi:putrescine transport system ATP-binding protein
VNETRNNNQANAATPQPWLDSTARPIVEIRGLSKHFGDVAAVDGVNLEIHRGELFSILGGSGSGKTTLLRMLAGFEEPTAGSILIDGIDMTRTPPYERPVNMMFQSYALFPHMNVEQNIAYGLKKEGAAPAEIRERVQHLLTLVKLERMAKRKPHQLSGGERQRVALARAVIKRPKLLLLDEPLAALDKKLREHTQFELMNLQFQLGITFVVVTHDQEEAMTLSTRIAVMNHGRFEQVGTPGEVYEFPRNRFVADFVGNINFFEATVTGCEGNRARLHCEAWAASYWRAAPSHRRRAAGSGSPCGRKKSSSARKRRAAKT